MIEKLIIIGSGPAGYTAAIYAARSNIKPLLITGDNEGGQIIKSNKIENWPGEYKPISGFELINKIKKQAKKFNTRIIKDKILKTNLKEKPIKLIGKKKKYLTHTLIIATGSSPKKLGLPLENKLYGKGISTCYTCDGYFYKNKNVAVVGGGNSAIEETIFLSKIANLVYLIHRRNKFKAESYLIKKIKEKKKNIIFFKNYIIKNIIKKDEKIKSIIIESKKTLKKKELFIDCLFISIGYKPNTNIFGKQIFLDKNKYIITNTNKIYPSMTNINGVFAAGDVIYKSYKQAITASASGSISAIDVQKYIEKNNI